MLRLWLIGGLLVLVLTGRQMAHADSRTDRAIFPAGFSAATPTAAPAVSPTPVVPLEGLAPELQGKIRSVMESPNLSAKGQPETFNTDPGVYKWLLANPHLTVRLWKQLGAKVNDIEDKGGLYRWGDENGSEVLWQIAVKAPGTHVWYAEGKVKPAMLVPMTSFRAVVVLHYVEGKDVKGKLAVQHQVHFMVRADSRAVALAVRLLGKSAPRMTEQYLGQLQTFYGGMAWYLSEDEERARRMYKQIGLPVSEKNR